MEYCFIRIFFKTFETTFIQSNTKKSFYFKYTAILLSLRVIKNRHLNMFELSFLFAKSLAKVNVIFSNHVYV